MYVELHSRSAFSFLEGASIPEELIAVCANLGMPGMALLDRDGIYGSPRFHLAAKKPGLKAHIGAEVTCAAFSPQRHRGGFRLPLLVASRAGYQNLCRLITKMKLRVGRKEGASASSSDFIEHADGLICLTGGQEGPLAAASSYASHRRTSAGAQCRVPSQVSRGNASALRGLSGSHRKYCRTFLTA